MVIGSTGACGLTATSWCAKRGTWLRWRRRCAVSKFVKGVVSSSRMCIGVGLWGTACVLVPHMTAAAQAEREAEQAERLLKHLAQPHLVHAHAHAARLARYMHTHDDRVLSAADSAFLQKRRRWSSTPATVYAPGPEDGVGSPLTTHRDRSSCLLKSSRAATARPTPFHGA